MAPKQNRRLNDQRKTKTSNLEMKQKVIRYEKLKDKNDQIDTSNRFYDDKKRREKSTEVASTLNKTLFYILIFILAVFCGILNSCHQYTLFENDRHFSHLSTLEREMTFRTEMGLYYSYYKTIIESSTLQEGLYNIMHNNLTEYPNTINTLKRFNLYPEILLGTAYRVFMNIAEYFQLNTRECWTVSRGDDLPPVESCEGLGEPAYFYITAVFVWNGLISSVIFLYGKFLSNSALGGLLAVMCFFFNHGECTRVQWTPPLRESFAYPILLSEMLTVTIALRDNRRNWKYFIMITGLTIASILSWQFSQFVLLTQLLAVFGTYMIGFISSDVLQMIIMSQMCSLAISCLLMFGNEMLLTSLFASTLTVAFILTLIDKQLKNLKFLPLIWMIQLLLLSGGSFGIKGAVSFIFDIRHDDHVWSILKSKFTSYKDFHTLLYTCAAEFSFMEKETPLLLSKTMLLPSAVFAIIISLFQIMKKMFRKHRMHLPDSGGEIIYNILQLGAFAIMAVLVMRLKLFFTPQLCLITSLLASKEHFNFLPSQGIQGAAVVLLMGLMSIRGIENIHSQRNILGEYNNPDLEQLLDWVSVNTPPDAVFAGPMSTMANLMLSTRRPIVNHPHYEDANLRERTKKVYTLFSRKPAEEVYNILSSMGVQFAVLEYRWCFGQTKKGCSMAEIWDVEDQSNRNKESLCQRLFNNPNPFTQVFSNHAYAILKLAT